MKRLFLIPLFIAIGFSAHASHVLGAEIGYRHISGLQYEVLVNIYGDCSGSSFPNYFSASTVAEVNVFNGTSLYTTLTCTRYGDYGKEITPVCPDDSNNTTCKSPQGTIHGIAEFRFRSIVTLNQASAGWKFSFTGNLGQGGGLAGRSNIITNVNFGTNGSIVYLEAELNNLNGPNNSPDLTTIPTPFFCVNQPQDYNTGAVDTDGDSLRYSLAAALEPSGNGATAVAYNTGYTGNQPLAASSFNFDAQSGQLSFVANQNQVSVVVNKIEEYRNGVLVGSMMREMNFIVLSNCSNQSPAGPLDSTSRGTLIGSNVLEICNADSVLNFSLSAYDPDSGNVNAVISGAPIGLTYNIIGNDTRNPRIDFNYIITPPLLPGTTYSFFVTFQDDGCPISSKQQFAYTIRIVQPISLSTTTLPEGCVPGNDGIVNIAATSSSSSSLEYSFNNGPFSAMSNYTGLAAGIYPFRVKDSLGCTAFNNVRVDTPPTINIDTITKTDISCFGASDGTIQVSSTPSSPSVSYMVNPGGRLSSTGLFEFLPIGVYAVIANGQYGCTDTGSIELFSPPDIAFTNVEVTNNRCEKGTGRIDIGSNVTIPVTYSISPNQQSNPYGGFGGLSAGFYIVTVVDTNGCYKDTLLEITDEPNNFALQLAKQNVSCQSDGNDGSAQVTATGGVEPYTYFWSSKYGTEGTQSSISNQRSGLKRVFVTDAIGCELDNYVVLEPANCCERVFVPNAFTPNGDGKNETFRLRSPLTMNDVNFFVVNRWGQKIWQTNNHLDGWDGNYEDGTPADIGTYFYFLKYQCDSDKSTYKVKGDVTIIR